MDENYYEHVYAQLFPFTVQQLVIRNISFVFLFTLYYAFNVKVFTCDIWK